MKNIFIKYIQNICIWVLKKTKYKFKIEHDKFEIQVKPIGIKEVPTRYDFFCHHKDVGFMNYITMVHYVYPEQIFDCSNPKVKGVKVYDEALVKNIEQQYNNLIKAIIKSGKVII